MVVGTWRSLTRQLDRLSVNPKNVEVSRENWRIWPYFSAYTSVSVTIWPIPPSYGGNPHLLASIFTMPRVGRHLAGFAIQIRSRKRHPPELPGQPTPSPSILWAFNAARRSLSIEGSSTAMASMWATEVPRPPTTLTLVRGQIAGMARTACRGSSWVSTSRILAGWSPSDAGRLSCVGHPLRRQVAGPATKSQETSGFS